ncbi:MAG: hypothetical protein IH945_10435 [Armatimonadetes bacterium]|nr:hypothetical protein [Armatimonadota bacterium]
MKLKYLAACTSMLCLGAAGAMGQGQIITQGWLFECWDLSQDVPAIYSDNYGINIVANNLFGASMGVSGTATLGGPEGFPCWETRTLDAAGRLSFFGGLLGSVQTTFDDGLAFTMGAPWEPVGDFTYARILLDDNTPENSELFGDGGLRLFYVGASKRYMVGGWTGGGVDVILTVRNVGDAAILWWDIMNLEVDPRMIGLQYGSWVAMHTGFGQVDSQSGANIFFMTRATNFGFNKLTNDLFSGYAVTGTTRAIRNDHNFRDVSTRFPDKVAFFAGQTEAWGLLATLVPDETQARLSPDPLNASLFIGATAADRIRIGQYRSGDGRGGTLWDNVMIMDVFADATGLKEEADIIITEHAYILRFPVQQVSPGGQRRIIQVIRSTWGVSDYNDPYTAIIDAPRLINSDPNGVDGLSPNPMTIRAYIDNQYAKLDQEVTMQNVRFIIELPPGLSLAFGEQQEKILATIAPNGISFVEWKVVSDGVTFGELPVDVTFAPTPGPVKKLTAVIRVAATPRMRIAAGAQMVTFPYTFPDSSIGSILDLQPEVDFRAFKWDPGLTAYVQASTAERGVGYWIIPQSDHGFVTLQNGVKALDTGTGGLLFTMYHGWNLIGNPYNYAVPLADLVAVVEDAPADSFTWDELVNNGFVSSALATWDRGPDGDGEGIYRFTTSTRSMMEPHKGYWIFVTTFKPIRISWPPVFAPGLDGSGRAEEEDRWTQSERHWRLQLAARTSDGADIENYLGQVADSQEITRLTLPKPPTAPGMTVELTIEGTLNGEPSRVAQAFTGRKAKSEWNFSVKTASSGDVTLTWPNLPSIPRNVRARLTDNATGEVRDLRAVSGYTFHMAEAGERDFTISIELGGSVRPVIGNVIVSRGPGGRLANAPMTISYALSADALVSVRILSGSGKEIFTVTRGRADHAGENEVTWNMRDNANRAVAPGVYRVEILAETPNGERVRKIVPINVIR